MQRCSRPRGAGCAAIRARSALLHNNAAASRPRRRHHRQHPREGVAERRIAAGSLARHTAQTVLAAPITLTSKSVGKVREGLASRMEADSDFMFKLLVELIQDQIIIVFTLLVSCGAPSFWTAAQFANAALLHCTAFCNDIFLMYFLAPVAASASGDAAPPAMAHMFQDGDHAMGARLRCWIDKFTLYAPLGVLSATASFVAMQCALGRPGDIVAGSAIARVALVGAIHLGVSANTRYQLINGADQLAAKHLDVKAARAATMGMRLCNQFIGGRLFLALSALLLA